MQSASVSSDLQTNIANVGLARTITVAEEEGLSTILPLQSNFQEVTVTAMQESIMQSDPIDDDLESNAATVVPSSIADKGTVATILARQSSVQDVTASTAHEPTMQSHSISDDKQANVASLVPSGTATVDEEEGLTTILLMQ